MIVSSRPDPERFLSWHAFAEYRVMPLSIDQLEGMIRRIDYDETDKKNFLRRVRGGLFKTHEKLLSNPLLASMMLLTFQEFQDIPSKMHVFYGTAFDVLFRRHDTMKPDYHREFKTSLELDEFKRVFMTLCFSSYVDKSYGFTDSSFSKYAKTAFDYENVEIDSSGFQYDLINNVCIMHREGENISFLHRSFQEYFAALFLSKRSIPEGFEFIEHILAESDGAAGCAGMLIDIDTEEFERKYLIQRLAKFEVEADRAKTDKGKVAFLSSHYVVGRVGPHDSFYLSPWRRSTNVRCSNHHLIGVLGKKYGFQPYDVFDNDSSEWWNSLPKDLREISHLIIVPASKIPVAAARKAGLIAFANSTISQARRLSKTLRERHERKRRLLSTALRKGHSS